MSAAGLVGATAGFLAAAGTVLSLWRGSARHAGALRYAYLWFAAAAAFVCANLIVGQAGLFPAGTSGMMLSFADLPAFAVLPVMVLGLAQLASVAPVPVAEPLPPRRSRRGLATHGAYLVDGYLLASALFLAGWVTVFGPAFTNYGEGAATFATELVHPLADLVFLAVTLAAAGAAGRRGTMPYLALAAMTVGDSLAVSARITGEPPGVAAMLALLAALVLLALAPWGWSVRPSRIPWPGAARGVTTGVAAVAAGLAAILVTVQAMVQGRLPQPVVLVVLGVTVVALGARVVGLVRRVNSWARVWQESGRRFRQLADRTSDVVLICDLEGVIRYASRAVTDYGYDPESMPGMLLADLLHPEDRAGGIQSVHRAVVGETQRAGRYPCRVRAADGTWRHVESTLSRYRDPVGPDQLLVTARDVSAQVELRRQITHLTFHDPLTGLPNRAFLERRTHDVTGQGGEDAGRAVGGGGAYGALAGPAEPRAVGDLAQPPAVLPRGGNPPQPPAVLPRGDAGSPRGQAPGPHGPQPPADGARVMAVMLGVDEFAALNDAGGRGAGDLLLAQIARRLRLAVLPQDTVARWGGEEFAVLIEGTPGHAPGEGAEAVEIAERLARSMRAQPFQLGEADVTVTVSVGVAFAGRGPAVQAWRNAELALSQARELGGNRVVVFGSRPRGTGRAPAGEGEPDGGEPGEPARTGAVSPPLTSGAP